MGIAVGNKPCPECRSKGGDTSGDNLVVYNDGSVHCFACGYGTLSQEFMEENGLTEVVEVGQHFDKEVNDHIKSYTTCDMDYRGIKSKTAKYFGVRYELDDDGAVLRSFYPTTIGYEIAGYKLRKHPKKWENPYGNVGKQCQMFGQFRFKTHSGICLIVGGEVDQLSAYQILDEFKKGSQYDSIAVVSSTSGESATAAQIKENYDFFNQFKKIIVCMDSDEAGLAATESICQVLPEHKAFVMKMRYKDVNEYIWDKNKGVKLNREQEFVNDFWVHREWGMDGIKTAAEGFDEIVDELTRERITLPPYMHIMQDMMGGGVLQGRIMNVIAYTSVGKSSHVDRMVYHWIFNSPVTPTIVSLEATAGQYMLNMLALHLHTNLSWSMSPKDLIAFVQSDEGQRYKNELCFKEDGSPRFFIIDERQGDIKALEKEAEKMQKKYDSKLLVVDVLSDLLRGSNAEYGEDHMNWQKQRVKEGVTIVNVMHTRKPPNGSDGKQAKATEYDALGTGSFVQSAAYNIVLNRDKLHEDEQMRNVTEVDLVKCRGGKTGPAGQWFYDFATLQCYELEDYVGTKKEKQKEEIDF